ncbi:hypothetical protein JCM10207_002817 [Rhodosporidiobolus poonsookiae]
MPFDPQTGIHSSPFPSIALPDKPLSVYDFLFDAATPYSTAKHAYQRAAVAEDALWLVDATSPKTYTFKQAHQRTLDLARAFHARGLKDEDAVVLFSPNDVEYGPCLWACFRQGGIVSCANPSYQPEELAHQMKTVNSHHPVKRVLVHPGAVETAVLACEQSGVSSEKIVLIGPPTSRGDSPANTKPLKQGFPTLDDLIQDSRDAPTPPKVSLTAENARTKLALLSFSSGTTGLPKAVSIPHYSVVVNVLQACQHWKLTSTNRPGDIAMGCLPFYHIYGLVVVLHGSLYQNIPVVVLPKFTFDGFLDAIQRHRISLLYMVPPMVVLLVKQALTEKYDLSSVRVAMAGAAPLTDDTITAFRAKFPQIPVGQGYGMTETCTIVSLLDISYKGGFPGSSAGALVCNIDMALEVSLTIPEPPPYRAKIVSPDGKLLPPGEVGELWSRSPSNALNYLGNEKATKETFDDDGFVHTGDECKIDEDGLLYVVDRIKELIKVSGFQVAPAELEGHLLGHPDVQDVCVIGVPDEKRGEAPKAFVVLTPSTSARLKADKSAYAGLVDSIKKHVTDHKIKYKALGEVEFLEAIPKTPSGKLLRKDLRALHAKTAKKAQAKM